MKDNNYLIPANSKKSQLILGFFTPIDLTIFLIGVGITIILLIYYGYQKKLVKQIKDKYSNYVLTNKNIKLYKYINLHKNRAKIGIKR